MSLKDKLWIAKYAPKCLEDTIMPAQMKKKITDMIKSKNIPNLGLFGPAGTGKTTTARVILRELGVENDDILFLNASDVNSVDSVRNVIKPFAMSMSSNDKIAIRFVILDEGDHLSPQAQAALRNLIEATYESARFIITANYPKKIIPALHSRLQAFILEKPDVEAILDRVVTILENEGVSVTDSDKFVELVEANIKDVRKLIQILQQSTYENEDGKLVLDTDKNVGNDCSELFEEFIELFKTHNTKSLRQLIHTKFTESDIEEFWTDMVNELVENYEEYMSIGRGLDNTIYHLNEAQKSHAFVANKHLNLIAFTTIALEREDS